MSSTAYQTQTTSPVESGYASSIGVDLDQARRSPERPTVLIVDDDADTVALLKTALRNEGMDVVGATDGFQALQKFGDVNPDIVLLDLMMPDLDGWETYRRLRQLSEVPIVIISAKASKEN
ncbi:MAG: response regulator, partial [Anaerolineales bacterium]|nr:response regulator [Anaerolineales bacterium]